MPNLFRFPIAVALAMVACFRPPSASAAETPPEPVAFDAPAVKGDAADAIKNRAGWTALKEGSPKGDLIVETGRTVVRFPKSGAVAEVFYKDGDAVKPGAVVSAVGASSRASLKLAATGSNGVTIESKDGETALRWTVKRGPSLEVCATSGSAKLSVAKAAEHLVLPDFFSDDLVFHAASLEAKQVAIPPDSRVLLEMADEGNLMLMCSWSPEVSGIQAAKDSGAADISSVQFGCPAGKALWVSLLSRPGIWHAEAQSGLSDKEDKALTWTLDPTLTWRIDFDMLDERELPIADTYFSVRQSKDTYAPTGNGWEGQYYAAYFSNPKTRTIWLSGFGNFIYPFYINDAGNTFLKIPKFSPKSPAIKRKYSGEVLAYLFDYRAHEKGRSEPKAWDVPTEVLFETLGPGYRAEIGVDTLDSYQGRRPIGVCGTIFGVEAIFKKSEQKQKTADIEKGVDNIQFQMTSVRGAINGYRTWAEEMLAYCETQKGGAKQEAVNQIIELLKDIPKHIEEEKANIKEPGEVPPQLEKIRALAASDSADPVAEFKPIGLFFTTTAGAQDDLMGECRKIARRVRQYAGLLYATAKDDETRAFADSIRRKCVPILKVKVGGILGGKG